MVKEQTQPDTEMFYRQLTEPQVVGTITAAEAREIKALGELIDKLQGDAQHAQRVLDVTLVHRLGYLRSLMDAHGLDGKDRYIIDPDSGQIKRTHELTLSQPEVDAGTHPE